LSDLEQNVHVTDIAVRAISSGLPQERHRMAVRSDGTGTLYSEGCIAIRVPQDSPRARGPRGQPRARGQLISNLAKTLDYLLAA